MRPVHPAQLSSVRSQLSRIGLGLLFIALVAWSTDFLFDVFAKYRQVDPGTYTMFWERRAWLWIHLAGGALTILLGPVQFLSRCLGASWLHRWAGRLFLVGMLVGSTGAVGLIATSPAPPSIRFAFAATALAWLTTALFGLVSIRNGRVRHHGAWMIRCYLVTLAPITFRAAILMPEVFTIVSPPPDGIAWLLWLSWVVPLAAYEMGRRIRRARARFRSPPTGSMPSTEG